MNSSVDQALIAFLKKHVDADKQAVEQALESQKILRDRLEAKCEEDETLPIPHTDGFLFGSLIRGTKIHPLDDVDYMFLLDAGGFSAIKSGQVVGPAAGVVTADNPFGHAKYRDEDTGYVSSAKIMGAIRDVLKESYPRSDVRKDGQAINVWLDAYGFGIDVVPSVQVFPQNGINPHYYIPIGHGESNWLETNPKIDLGAYEQEDVRRAGRLRPVARLVRTWNIEANASRLGGFMTDIMVLRAARTASHGASVSILLAHFFALGADMLRNPLPQPTGFEPSIDKNLDDESRRLSMNALEAASQTAARAVLAEMGGDTAGALRTWAALLGEELLVMA